MGLLNILGIKKDIPAVSKNPQRRELPKLPVESNDVQSLNETSKAQQHFNEKLQVTEFPEVTWEEMPEYRNWVNEMASDLVIRLLADTDRDGELYTYPGLVSYLAPTGRYFFPTAFFAHKYEYVDQSKPGFMVDASRCRSPIEVKVFIQDNIVILPKREPVKLPLDNYKIGSNVKNPLS